MFTFRASPCKVMMHEIIMRLFLSLKRTLARMSLLCVLTDQPAPQVDCLLLMEDWELLSGIKAVTACPPVGSAAESQQHKLP